MASEASFIAARAVMESFGLTKREWNKEITSEHLNEISRFYCREWWRLIPQLNLRDITENDINDRSGSSEEKRRIFFRKWKHMKGSEATYKQLVSALLKIECKKDSEAVCQLLLQSPSPSLLQEERLCTNKVTHIINDYTVHFLVCFLPGHRKCLTE